MRKLLSGLDDKTRNFILLYVDIAIAVCLSAAIGGAIQSLSKFLWGPLVQQEL